MGARVPKVGGFRFASTRVSERTAGLVLAMWLAGCSSEPCADRFVPPLDGLMPKPAEASKWAVVGRPHVVTVLAPTHPQICGFEVTVSARLRDPSNAEVPVTSVSTPRPDERFGVMSTTVEFTPTSLGPWYLEVSFNPSLGTSTLLVQVVENGLSRPVRRVPRPAGCDFVWPLDDETIACEGLDGGLAVSSADGTLRSFPGKELVVAGDAMWSLDGERLEFRRFVSGQLSAPVSLPGFVAAPTPSIHTDTTAMRFMLNDEIARVDFVDGGLVSTPLHLGRPTSYPTMHYLDWFSRLDVWTPADQIVAFEPEVVWYYHRGVLPPEAPVFAHLRSSISFDEVLFEVQPAVASSIPMRGVERVPLWLDLQSDAGLTPLVEVRGGRPAFSAWPRAEVLQVGLRHVVVADDDPQWVHVYRK